MPRVCGYCEERKKKSIKLDGQKIPCKRQGSGRGKVQQGGFFLIRMGDTRSSICPFGGGRSRKCAPRFRNKGKSPTCQNLRTGVEVKDGVFCRQEGGAGPAQSKTGLFFLGTIVHLGILKEKVRGNPLQGFGGKKTQKKSTDPTRSCRELS